LPEREGGCERSAPAPGGGFGCGGSAAVAAPGAPGGERSGAAPAALKLLEAQIVIACLSLELRFELIHFVVELFDSPGELTHLIGERIEPLLGLQSALGRRGHRHQHRQHGGRGRQEEKS